MPKNVLFLLCTLCLAGSGYAQQSPQPFYDALDLAEHLEGENLPKTSEVYQVLGQYLPNPPRDPSDVEVAFSGNEFIQFANPQSEIENLTNLVRSPVAAIGGLNVTNVADGVAQFLVQRAKEELTATFFKQFKEALAEEQYGDMRTLFPSTYLVLQVIDEEVYNYAAYLATLREAFQKDLRSILTHLPDVINNHPDYFAQNTPLKGILLSGIALVKGLRQGQHPAAVLASTAVVEAFADINPDLQSAVKVFNLFSNALRSKDPTRYWVSPDSLRLLQGNTFRLFLGLVYQQTPENITFDKGQLNFKENIFKPIAGALDQQAKVRVYVEGLIDRAAVIDRQLQNMRQVGADKLAFADYYALFEATLAMLEHAVSLDNEVFPKLTLRQLAYADTLVAQARTLSDIYLDLRHERYAGAVFQTSVLLKNLLGDDFTYGATFLKYGSFMAAVAEAKSGEEVKQAIEAIALPAGSASIKRRTKRNVALNAYVGLAGGLEWLEVNEKDNRSMFGVVQAPIGVAISWGRDQWQDKKWQEKPSLSLFLSLIDLGAVTAFRFKNDEAESLPDLSFANLFAPGVSVVLGLSSMPISVGVGGQFGPALRGIEGEDKTVSALNLRAHFFVAVDIPLLNFKTVPREK